jgi:Flp pilus assembly protein TadG
MRHNARVSERGSATTELVLITPVLIVVLFFVVALGRVASSRAQVEAAARDAARDAANARSVPEAIANSDAAARGDLHEGGVSCRSLAVALDTADFRAGGAVTATVSCTVALQDLVGLHLPAARTITARFTAPIDLYRAVS